MLKKISAGILAAFLLLAGVMAFNALRFESLQLDSVPEPQAFSFDEQASIERFSQSLTFRTVSTERGIVETDEFRAFHEFLQESYPALFGEIEPERVNDWTLLFTWPGSDPTLKPVLLMAHQDVVPAESPDEWEYPPFEGTVADGIVRGRGAIDNKSGMMGILEAVEVLITEGFEPERTIYLMFGHDEEIGGMDGARVVAEQMAKEGIELEIVLDEGGYIVEDELPLDRPVAVIGTSEKGYVSLELVTRTRGGHSSMPPRQTAVGILASAVHKLQNNPFPASISGPADDMFAYIGPEMSFGEKMITGNMWLTEPLVIRIFERNPSSDAMLRTTIAPTMMRGSEKDNILPAEAEVVINFRVLPGESVDQVIEYVERTIDDERVEIRVHRDLAVEPSPISDAYGNQFLTIHKTIRQIYPEVYVAPFLMVAATDSRHFTPVSDHVFRFLPAHLNETEAVSFHAIDEQLRTEIYIKMIRFYRQLIVNTAIDFSGEMQN